MPKRYKLSATLFMSHDWPGYPEEPVFYGSYACKDLPSFPERRLSWSEAIWCSHQSKRYCSPWKDVCGFCYAEKRGWSYFGHPQVQPNQIAFSFFQTDLGAEGCPQNEQFHKDGRYHGVWQGKEGFTTRSKEKTAWEGWCTSSSSGIPSADIPQNQEAQEEVWGWQSWTSRTRLEHASLEEKSSTPGPAQFHWHWYMRKKGIGKVRGHDHHKLWSIQKQKLLFWIVIMERKQVWFYVWKLFTKITGMYIHFHPHRLLGQSLQQENNQVLDLRATKFLSNKPLNLFSETSYVTEFPVSACCSCK